MLAEKLIKLNSISLKKLKLKLKKCKKMMENPKKLKFI
jgi:hypothetical protein